MNYIVYSEDGRILRTGNCPDDHLELQAGEGETAIEDTYGDTYDSKHRIIDGGRVEFTPIERVKGYGELRALAYPPITDQLDAIWHGMNDGLIPKIPNFYDPIAAVKSSNPKE